MTRVRQPRQWHDLTPALGLIVGAALGLLLGALTPDVGTLAIEVVVGATLGLIVGSVIWLQRRP